LSQKGKLIALLTSYFRFIILQQAGSQQPAAAAQERWKQPKQHKLLIAII
jgi:hypothetical protein